jgi:NADH:ubiquinone oxidoreductase subunit 4 (subunit M)
MLATLAVIVIFLGIYPAPMLDLMNVSLSSLAGILHQAGANAMLGVQ